MKGFTVLERVRKTITRYNMLPAGARVAVAVSGGPDSVCLLHVLTGLAADYGIQLSVAHFNHKLRGEESDRDEHFAAAIAAGLGLPFHRAEGDVAAAKDNLEQAARRARRGFFSQLMASGPASGPASGSDGIDCIALGHTRDDQAETVMFRLLRGSGLAGLAGVYPVTGDGYVRPLIDVTRAEVEEFLRARGIAWREDSSNVDPRFARNRIRRQLLPQLSSEWNPHLRESLARLADLAHEEERWWKAQMDDLAARFFERRDGGVEFQLAAPVQFPLAIKRRFIRRAISEAKGDLRGLEFGHIEQVLDLMDRSEGRRRLRLPGGYDVRRSCGWLRIAPACPPREFPQVVLHLPGAYAAADGTEVRFEVQSRPSAERRGRPNDATLKTAELSLRRLPARLELRGWKPGDEYRPEGQIHGRKVKEMFQQAAVPSWRRPYWPIVGNGATIVWARQFGAAAEFAAGHEAGPVLRVWEVSSQVKSE